MNKYFSNLSLYTKFILKKEKINIILYTLLMSVFMVVLVPVFENILETSSNMQVLIETMKNPAMIAMVGPVFVGDSYTTASMYGNYMTVFTGIILAIWNILFVTKHLRNDEELGRLELVRTNSVGKLSNITAVLFIAFLVNLLTFILMVFGFYFISSGSMPLEGNINYSLATCGFAFLFAVISALFSQISSTARIANSLSFITLFVVYIMRAIGDVSVDSLSYLSPLGLVSKAQSFVNDYYWPLIIIILEILVLIAITYLLAYKRDLGEGLVKEKQASANLSPLVRGVTSFVFKLQKTQIIIWSLVIFSFASMYGSVLGDLEGYINSSEMLKNMLQIDSEFSLTEQFVSLLVIIMSMISALATIAIFNRISDEESKNLSEEILTKPVSRINYLLSFIIVAVVCAIIFQILIALGFWLVGKNYLVDIPDLSTFFVATINFLPAILLSISIAILAFGISPKLSWLGYLFLGYSFLVVYIGRLFNFPKIMEKISPFGFTPTYPTEELNLSINIILLALSIIISLVGITIYRKRDIS